MYMSSGTSRTTKQKDEDLILTTQDVLASQAERNVCNQWRILRWHRCISVPYQHCFALSTVPTVLRLSVWSLVTSCGCAQATEGWPFPPRFPLAVIAVLQSMNGASMHTRDPDT